MADSLKKKTVKGIAWSSVDKLFTTIISFVISILIARLLMPADYGVVGILYVFIVFSEIFIDGGLSVALIQKHNCSQEDFETAFFYNLLMSVSIYALLFVSAPAIAQFYGRPEIEFLLRVMSLTIIVSAFSSIQNTRLQIEVDFRRISLCSVTSSLLSGVVGLLAAYKGFGAWALVAQHLSLTLTKTIMLNVVSHWHPRLRFSKESFRTLFSFGYKLILTNILARVYDNLYPLIIGKLYPMNTLGYYSRAQHFANMPVTILKDVFQRVSFPIMSSIKDDRIRLAKIYRLYIEMSSAVIFPIMFMLILVSKPLVLLLLTEKWVEAYPFLQILSLGLMFGHISAINLNLLFVEGRSDLALKLEVIKKNVAISIFLLSVLGGIWGICIGQALYNFIAIFFNSRYTKQLIGVSYYDQIRDYGKVWLLAAASIIVPVLITHKIESAITQLLLGISLYIVFYFMFNTLLKTNAYHYAILGLQKIKNRKSK